MVKLEVEFGNHVRQEDIDRKEIRESQKELVNAVRNNTVMVEKLDTKIEKQKSWYAGFSAAIVLIAGVLALGLKKLTGI